MGFLLTILYRKKTLSFILLGVFFIIIIFVYMAFSLNVVRGEYKIKELRTRIEETGKINNQLRIQLTSASSLNRVLELSDNLSYVEVEKVNYIKKSDSSPFATR